MAQHRFSLYILGALAAALVLMVLVAVGAFERSLTEAAVNRYAVVLDDLVRALAERGGVDGASARSLRLEQEMTHDPRIEALQVFDAAGRIVHSTEATEIGELLPGLPTAPQAPGTTWSVADPRGLVIGQAAMVQGRVIGGVSLRYAGRRIAARLERFVMVLASTAAALLALAVPVVVLGLRWALGPVRRDEDAAAQRLAASDLSLDGNADPGSLAARAVPAALRLAALSQALAEDAARREQLEPAP